jgi:hypothetical protein
MVRVEVGVSVACDGVLVAVRFGSGGFEVSSSAHPTSSAPRTAKRRRKPKRGMAALASGRTGAKSTKRWGRQGSFPLVINDRREKRVDLRRGA